MVKLEPVTGEPAQLRRAYGCFPGGVTALCALDGEEPVGIAAGSFTCVSIEPGLVSVCDQLLCYSRFGTLPHDKIMRSIELLGTRVIPELEKRGHRVDYDALFKCA